MAGNSRIKAAAKKNTVRLPQALVVIGIGGSIWAPASPRMPALPNYNLKRRIRLNIHFIGNGLSSDALTECNGAGGRRTSL